MKTTLKTLTASLGLLTALAFTACDGGSSAAKSSGDSTRKEEKESTGFSFNKGTKKDLSTGLSTNWNGLNVEEAYLMDMVAKKRLSDNKVELNQKIAITVTGVNNLEEKNGKVMPGLDITVTDEAGGEILAAKDLLKQEFDKEAATTLDATLTIGNPMQSGKKYHMKARFYDKNGKPGEEIISEADLEVK